jgi:hypothetical protein
MASDDNEIEGWYQDPFRAHEDRWFSAGTPTALVRDGETESHDPPPDEPFAGSLHDPVSSTPAEGVDLHRADEAQQPSDGPAVSPAEAAMESAPISMPPS